MILYVIIAVIAVVGIVWWNFGGKRRIKRRIQYNAEKRQERLDEEDREWREKQEQKRK
jgi:hypothetical protein